MGSALGQANVLLAQARLAGGRGEHERAGQLFDAARALYEQIGDRYSLGRLFVYVGDYLETKGARAEACASSRRAEQVWRLEDLVALLSSRIARACDGPA